MVLAKEHIDAALPTAETPKAESEPGPTAEIRPMADDEIAVEAYVMKPEVRGTSRDPSALAHEQWIVRVRMLDDGRTFQVLAGSGKVGEIARERPGKSQVPHRQEHGNGLGCRD